ncbi:MAG: UvrD-helicase domain-containing protein [Planctomycetota bacterium]
MTDVQREADAASRERACTEFERPVLLVAGAGTGKTATLVARVVVWLTGPGWERARARFPDERDDELAKKVLGGVVAITFTDAAAAEMAGRIEAALAALEAGQAVIGLDPALLAAEGEQLDARVRALRQEIDALVAVTIHSWCHKFLAAHPLEAGLSPGFTIDGTKTLARQALREAFDALLALDADSQLGRDLVTLAAAGKSPQKLEQLANELIGGGATSDVVGLHVFEERAEGAALFDAFAKCLAELNPALDALTGCKGRSKGSAECAHACLALAHDVAGEPPEGLGAWSEFQTELATRFTDAKFNKLKKWKADDIGKGECEQLGPLVDSVAAPADDLVTLLGHFLATDLELAQPLTRVLHAALAGFEADAANQGFVTFDQLLRQTARVLHERSDVARAAREGMDQLLVDEFQDTDEIQCSIVRTLALEGDGDRPSLFLIGDPKQSIYAFRGADMTAFDAFERHLLDAGGERLELCVNFRSVPAILDEVDRNFATTFERLPGLQPAFAALLPRSGRANGAVADGAAAHIEHWVSWDRDEDERYFRGDLSADTVRNKEGLAIAADIAALSGGDAEYDWSRVAILVQTQTYVEALLEPLRELGVPFELVADKSYFRRREVVDAVSSVRAAFDPDDEVALAALLRAPFVGVPDAGLVALWNAGFPTCLRAAAAAEVDDLVALESAVDEAARQVRATGATGGIDDWTGRAVHAARTLLAGYRASHTEPLEVALEVVRDGLGQERVEAARFLGGLRSANLRRLWHTLTARVVDEGLDVPELLRTLRADVGLVDEDRANVSSRSTANAVRLMTMHGSKGLEFEHVYLAQLGRNRQHHSTAPVLRRGGRTVWCADGLGSPSYPALAVHQRHVEAAEAVRLFYVAATRARERLVFSGPRKADAPVAWRSATRLDDLLRGHEELARLGELQSPHDDAHGARWRFAADHAQGSPVARPPREAPKTTQADVLARNAAREAAAMRAARPRTRGPSALHAGTAPQLDLTPADAELARHVGTLVHRWFEAGGERELDELTHDLDRARDLVAAAHEVIERARAGGLLERFRSLRANIVAHELPYLAPPCPDASPGAAVDAEAGSIDLLLFDAASSTWTVVDFKTDRVSTPDDIALAVARHTPQLEAYARAVATATGGTVAKELWLLRAGAVESVGAPVTAADS